MVWRPQYSINPSGKVQNTVSHVTVMTDGQHGDDVTRFRVQARVLQGRQRRLLREPAFNSRPQYHPPFQSLPYSHSFHPEGGSVCRLWKRLGKVIPHQPSVHHEEVCVVRRCYTPPAPVSHGRRLWSILLRSCCKVRAKVRFGLEVSNPQIIQFNLAFLVNSRVPREIVTVRRILQQAKVWVGFTRQQ